MRKKFVSAIRFLIVMLALFAIFFGNDMIFARSAPLDEGGSSEVEDTPEVEGDTEVLVEDVSRSPQSNSDDTADDDKKELTAKEKAEQERLNFLKSVCGEKLEDLRETGSCREYIMQCFDAGIYGDLPEGYNPALDSNCNGSNNDEKAIEDNGVLFESEFFNPSGEGAGDTDNPQGLVADGQRDFIAEADARTGSPLVDFIVRIASFLIWLIGVVALVLVVISGYFMLFAAGDEETISKGKDIFVSALIGIVIVVFSFLIIRFVQALLF